jgi:phosphohistidine phosphatase
MAEKRTLLLMRHAKSDWPAGVDDIERPLAGRGRRDAKAAAALFARRTAPQLVLCSPALRTRQTLQLVRQGFDPSPVVRFQPVIYGANWSELVQLIRRTPDSAQVLLVIGHEPTMSTTVRKLAGPGGDRGALSRIEAKFPTSGIATLTLPGEWADVAAGTLKLTRFDVPRG